MKQILTKQDHRNVIHEWENALACSNGSYNQVEVNRANETIRKCEELLAESPYHIDEDGVLKS